MTIDDQTSNLNWYEVGQTLANQATTAVSADGRATVTLGGSGGAVHVIIDLQAYYL